MYHHLTLPFIFKQCFVYCVTWAAEHCFSDIFRERDGDYTLRLKG